MVKIDDLTEDQINALPPEVKEAVTNGITEVRGARGVIGDLNKKLKKTSDDDTTPKFGKEEMDEYMKNKEKTETLDKFVTDNPLFEEKKDKMKSLMDSGLSIEESKGAIIAGDETFKNNLNTNQAGIGGGNPTGHETTSQKQSFETYQGMSPEEKSAYTNTCAKDYGGLTFSDTHSSDD